MVRLSPVSRAMACAKRWASGSFTLRLTAILPFYLRADVCRLSVVNHLELSMALERQATPDAARESDAFLRAASILHQGALARQAYYDFGRGRHRARLNFGDCFAYALAKSMDEALLFKGEDFVKTDVRVASRGDF